MNTISNILWLPLSIIILLTSIYFLFKLNFITLKLHKIISSLNIKSFKETKSLLLTLSGKIGIGSISGIAISILYGGPGTIFYIWIISFLTSTLTYAETYLSMKYRIKDNDLYKGGPSYYIKYGLKNNKLSKIYSLSILICYIIGFISIQSNTVITLINDTLNINKTILVFFLCLILLLVLYKSTKKITDISSKIVPFMLTLYIIITIYIIITNIKFIPHILNEIIYYAFHDNNSIKGGLLFVIITGIKRNIFASETSVGTAGITSSSSSNKTPKQEGLLQILGVYIITMLICTCTSIIVLSSPYKLINENDGIKLISHSLTYHLGSIGNIFLIISIFLFAFTTIITAYYYGEISLKALNKPNKINILKTLVIIICIISSYINSNIIWQITDILLSIICYINIYSIIKLRKEIKC